MKKYKLLKDLPFCKKGIYELIERNDTLDVSIKSLNTGLSYNVELSRICDKEWFEEIKEEETIQWKVGDKYCFEGHDYKTFGIIDRLRIEGGKYYMWGAGERWYLLDETRLAIPEEIQKYFN